MRGGVVRRGAAWCALVKVAGAPLHTDVLLECDADVGDVVGVEEAAELAVGEAERE